MAKRYKMIIYRRWKTEEYNKMLKKIKNQIKLDKK